MIQFNLLPDVKLEFIKARRLKRLVTLSAVSLSAISLLVLVLFIVSVDIVQKKSLRDLNADITSNTQQIRSIKDFNDILTVQNQLNTLTGLHDKKAVASRLFGYITQLTPNGVTMSSLNIDFTQNTLSLTGAAPDLTTVNQFIDTLKATTYKTNTAGSTDTPAFSKVVLSSFSRGDKGTAASYATTFSFDPVIFDNTQTVSLSVPNSTVSNTSVLFQGKEQ